MKLKCRSGDHCAAGCAGNGGSKKEFWSKIAVSYTPLAAAAAPQPSSLPVCLRCLFTSLFNHDAVPVVN